MSEVAALYASNGANWNDYLLADGSDRYTANDTMACNAASDGPGYNACIHGGESRSVLVYGYTDCTGVSAADDLTAFTWTCIAGSDASSDPLKFVSTVLNVDIFLSNLIDWTAAPVNWLNNRVTVTLASSDTVQTPLSKWWSNTFEADNDGGSLTTSGTIYVVTSNTGADYTLGAHQVALVTGPNIKITGADSSTKVINASSFNFLWVEAFVDAASDSMGMDWSTVKFSVVRNFTVTGSGGDGINISASPNNYFLNITISNSSSRGFEVLSASNNNQFLNITIDNSNFNYGFYANSSTSLVVSRIHVSNTDNWNIYLSNSGDSTIIDATISNGDNWGFYFSNSGNSRVLNSTVANNSNWGYYITNSDNSVITNAVAVNGANYGIYFSSSDGLSLMNLASAHNANYGIYDSGDNNHYTGLIKSTGNSSNDCRATGSTPGIVTGTCANAGTSDATATITGFDLNSAFVGKVSSDSSNTSHSSGTELFENITDWSNFDNHYRGWGLDGSAFPADDQDDRCETTGFTCRIWDWSLSASDSVIRDILSDPDDSDTIPDGDDTFTHTWNVTSPSSQADCDAAVTGSTFTASACKSTFLRNAVEIVGDYIGDDDGLCESNEICLFTPNIGAYQGHGSLISAGTFTDGALTGITLLRFETNGY